MITREEELTEIEKTTDLFFGSVEHMEKLFHQRKWLIEELRQAWAELEIGERNSKR